MKKILFIFMFFCFNFSVYAMEHLDLVPIDSIYSNQYNLKDGSYFSSNQKKYIMDDKIVYCVEPGVNIMTRSYNGNYNLLDSGIDSNILNRIALIGYFGYDYPSHHNDNYFLAAQELIWEELGDVVYFTTGINDTGMIYNIDSEKGEILTLVNNYNVKPSFDSFSVSGIYGSELVLVDNNNVLSFYDVISSMNNVYIDGNRLIINVSNVGDDQIILKRKKYDDSISVFYEGVNSQDFMFLRPDDVFSSVNVSGYVPLSNITIFKKGLSFIDYHEGFIYDEVGLDGTIFDLYAQDDIYFGGELLYSKDMLIESLTTTSGYASSIDLPNGNYYLKEVHASDGYVLDDSIINVCLNNDGKEVYTHMVSLSNRRQEVFINLHKMGEHFEGIIDNNGSYSNVNLSGVKFGLYNSNPIYNDLGDIIVSKDTLISEFTTNEFGVINEKLDVPFGTYYLRELETVSGYVLDNNIYEFGIYPSSSETVHISITKEPLINEGIKGNLIINKVDGNFNKLSGAHFKLFDSYDNLIYDGYTDGDGSININNLGYGKYYFYEEEAPVGYQLNNNIYEFFITDNNELLKFDVPNYLLPVTSNIYDMPKSLSMIGLSFGLLSLSMTVIYEKNKSV